ncbi:MAG: FAD-dependent oxidoreductase [Clostridia bacterium]|nr:FAD-dependent oxidoreductase [Clostridia bacterium]
MFKRVFSVILALVCSMGALALAETYQPGEYSATVFGMMGDVTVTMTFDAEAITNVTVVGDAETPGIGTLAIEQLPDAILAAQSAEVDAVTGATVTSNAIKEAVLSCIAQAKGEEAAAGAPDEIVTEADVIVVGAGAAGLSAAWSAANAGASVIVLEANGRTGGSAILSGGNLNGFDEEVRQALGRNDKDMEAYLAMTEADFPAEYAQDLAEVQEAARAYLADSSVTAAYDSVARVMLDHWNKGKGQDLDGVWATINYDYVRKAVEANEDIYQWLLAGGITFKAPTTKHYVTPNNKGAELIEVLQKLAEDAGAKIVYNTRGVALTVDEAGKVNGVEAETAEGKVTYTAKGGVVLATGSFASNPEMVVKYQNVGRGISVNTGSSNPPTNIGDGIVMAEAVGAKLYDMQFVGYIWRGYKSLGTTAEAGVLGGAKQLAVNAEGVRFTNDTAANLQAAAIHQTDAVVNMVGDRAMYEALEANTAGLTADLEARGLLFTGDTLEEAAQKAGLDGETLAATVAAFNDMVDAGADPDFGRTSFNGKVVEAPFVIAKCQAVNHLTYGGVDTDLETRVLREDGSVIDGLYAAGDVVAGFEGYAHQTGECLTIAMYYGRLAGENAAK